MSVASDSMLARDTHLFVDLLASIEMRNILWAREKKQTEFERRDRDEKGIRNRKRLQWWLSDTITCCTLFGTKQTDSDSSSNWWKSTQTQQTVSDWHVLNLSFKSTQTESNRLRFSLFSCTYNERIICKGDKQCDSHRTHYHEIYVNETLI